MAKRALSHSAATLDEILVQNGVIAKGIRENFRTAGFLSRLRRGVRLPDLRTAVKMRKVSRGRIKEEGWLEPVKG